MNWYIGQRVICVKSHSDGAVKKGQIFTIKEISEGFCMCNDMSIDVGIRKSNPNMQCRTCGIDNVPTYGIWWLSETLFAPIEEIPESHEEAIKELLKETICQTL